MRRRELAAAMAERRMADQDCSWSSMPPETFIPAWHAQHVHPLQRREEASLCRPLEGEGGTSIYFSMTCAAAMLSPEYKGQHPCISPAHKIDHLCCLQSARKD